MATKDNHFAATIDEWVSQSQARTEAVFKDAVTTLIEDAQRPVAKGGRMRVDTGFLRASGQVSLNNMPSGPVRGEPGQVYTADTAPIVLEIARAKPGDTIFFGWSANYARVREYHDAFLRTAVQRWQQIVDASVAKAKQRIR